MTFSCRYFGRRSERQMVIEILDKELEDPDIFQDLVQGLAYTHGRIIVDLHSLSHTNSTVIDTIVKIVKSVPNHDGVSFALLDAGLGVAKIMGIDKITNIEQGTRPWKRSEQKSAA